MLAKLKPNPFAISQVDEIELGRHIADVHRLKSIDGRLYVECHTKNPKTGDQENKPEEIIVIEDQNIVARHTLDGIVTDFIPSNDEKILAALVHDIVESDGKQVEKIAGLGEAEWIHKLVLDGDNLYMNISSHRYIGDFGMPRKGLVQIGRRYGGKSVSWFNSHYKGSVDDIMFDGSRTYALIVPDYPCDLGESFIGVVDKEIERFAELKEKGACIASDGENLYVAVYTTDKHHCRLARIEGDNRELVPVSEEFHIGWRLLDLRTDGTYTTALCLGNSGQRCTRVLQDGQSVPVEQFLPYDRSDFIANVGSTFYAPLFTAEILGDTSKLVVFDVKKS